jgi:hypothetical protein
MVGPKVQGEVLSVLNGGQMPDGWNETNIVLIPKVKNPEKSLNSVLLVCVMFFINLS